MSSSIWAHFTKNRVDANATCHHCSAKLNCKKGSTKEIWQHLQNKHRDKYKEQKSADERKETEQTGQMIAGLIYGNKLRNRLSATHAEEMLIVKANLSEVLLAPPTETAEEEYAEEDVRSDEE
uniref:BED-type domain-containing protein n=1 Tax=Ditylenchus dipsaci TaxID=166011 RepID=A0A915EUW5_9BILA